MSDIEAARIESARRRGRGASSNPTGRFEREQRETVDDGWDLVEDLPPIRTEVRIERPRA